MSGQYEALAAKAKAMYGKRIRPADLTRITALRTVDEVLDDLRRQPGWAAAAASLPEGALLTRAVLEGALRDQIRKEGLRLAAFIPQRDRPLMEFPIVQAELERILAAYRRLRASMFKEVDPLPTAYILHSKVDLEGLARCQDFGGLVDATRGSIYYPALSRLRGSSALPEYGVVEALLWGEFYRHRLRLIRRQYDGDVGRVLERSVGSQVDMLNILHVLRLKQYFPQENDCLPVLMPCYYKVKPEQIRAMCAAPTAEAVLELAAATPYASVFRGARMEELNNLYAGALYRSSRRQLLMGRPSIYSAVAYLNLRELELKAVVSAVEASKYRQPMDPSFLRIMS